MSAPNKATDKRADFFKDHFNKALPFQDYINTGSHAQVERWQAMLTNISLTSEDHKLISGFKRKMNILVLSGVWCGDCIRQGPMLEIIAQANPLINLRFIDNQENPELRDELRIQGGTRVPVVVFLSEDFNELCRFGDKTLSAYRRKMEKELGTACDAGLMPPPLQEINDELAEWLAIVERCQLILRLSPALRARYGD